MLHFLKNKPGFLCDRISRREWLQVGGLSLAGLSLPGLFRAEATAKSPAAKVGKAKSCIMLWLAGGPSQPDMWDMKPEAPAQIRGEFKPCRTTVPGIIMSEHLPLLSKQAHHVTLVNSVHHNVGHAHCAASYFVLTGEDRGDSQVAFGTGPNDHPGIGAVLTRFRPPEKPIVPYVTAPWVIAEGIGGPPSPGIYGGWMGKASDPFEVNKHRSDTEDPDNPKFGFPELQLRAEVDQERLVGRKGLLGQVNGRLDAIERGGAAGMMDAYQQRALSLLTSSDTRKAFDLNREPERLRERYGRNQYGQSCLLARRLVEAGTRMVMVRWAPDANATWDTHGTIGNMPVSFEVLKKTLLPQLDSGLGTLIDDLNLRGLLSETLIIAMGEFGRSPKVNPWGGRDHWPRCYSVFFAGGGAKGGFVYGKSDRIGADPAENPVTPQEIVATIYSLLGIPADLELTNQVGKPARVVLGQAIQGVIA